MAGLFIRALPFDDALIEMKGENAGKPTDVMSKWAESIQRQTGASPVSPNPAERLPAVTSSTAGTIGGPIPAGLYAIYVYREVIAADPVSSGCGVELTWTHNSKAMSRILSAFAGAPQAVTDSAGDVEVIATDPNTSIGYVVTYASNTPALAQFEVDLLASLLQTLS